MKRAMRLLSVLLLTLVTRTTAQITITSVDLQREVGRHVVGTIHLMDTSELSKLGGLLAAAGPDKRYDFTPYVYASTMPNTYDVLPSAGGTPAAGDERLSGANFVRVWTTPGAYGGTTHAYLDLASDRFAQLGSAFIQATDYDLNGTLDTFYQHLDPSDRTPLPLVAGSGWSQTFVATSTALGTTSSFTISETAAVEGWGELVTPAGTRPALRVRRIRTTTPAVGAPITSTFIDFMTTFVASASIVLDEAGSVIGATYIDGTSVSAVMDDRSSDGRMIRCTPHPVSGASTISFGLASPGRASLRLFDMNGRLVRTLLDAPLPAGSHVVRISSDELGEGVYVCRFDANGVTAARRLIVGR
jgi:hypothetical protein